MPRAGAKPPHPPLLVYLRRRGQRRRAIVILLVVVGLLLAMADHRGWLLYAGDDVTRYHGKWFDVVEVTDGDTLKVRAPDGDEPVTRVRLWGIDTPELGYDGNEPQPFAREATEFTTRLAAGGQVRLWLEPHYTRGQFGRLVAYVELRDGSSLNEQLLAVGLARLDRRFSHTHTERYERLWEQARHDKSGIWQE